MLRQNTRLAEVLNHELRELDKHEMAQTGMARILILGDN